MGGFLAAWLFGEGIIVYRWVKAKAPPTPGALLIPSALFLGLAVIAEYQPARFTVTAFAWALDAAILLQVVGKDPKQVTGWPPLMINDPSKLLPPGGTSAAAGTTAATTAPPAAPSVGLA